MFDSSDLSQVKKYLQSQLHKIIDGTVSIQDFCFSKEVKLGSYKAGGSRLPPGAAVSTKVMKKDPRAGPQYRERVPYVVVAGAPGDRLVDRCVQPDLLLNSAGTLHLDTEYYITKTLLPPLDRLFSLAGADIKKWYAELPKSRNKFVAGGTGIKGAGLNNFIKSGSCTVCGETVSQRHGNLGRSDVNDDPQVCANCQKDAQNVVMVLTKRAKERERELVELDMICRSCSQVQPSMPILCISQDCPVYYSRKKAIGYYNQACKSEWAVLSKALEW